MGEAFFCKRGSGTGKVAVGAAAMLCVKFPPGSTCRCEMGSNTLRAENAPGLAAFALPAAGTWSVTIQNGAQEKSRSVTVPAGDVKVVAMTYAPDELVILSPESGLAAGYSGQEGAQMEGGTLTLPGASYLSPAIDLTDYTAISITAMTTWAPAQGYHGNLFLDPDQTARSGSGEDCALVLSVPDFELTTYTADISALTGPHYLGALAGPSPTAVTSIVLTAEGGSGT